MTPSAAQRAARARRVALALRGSRDRLGTAYRAVRVARPYVEMYAPAEGVVRLRLLHDFREAAPGRIVAVPGGPDTLALLRRVIGAARCSAVLYDQTEDVQGVIDAAKKVATLDYDQARQAFLDLLRLHMERA